MTDKEWFNKFRNTVRKIVGKSVPECDLDDLVQNILLFILEKSKHYKSSKSSYQTFVYKGLQFGLSEIYKKINKTNKLDENIIFTEKSNFDIDSGIDIELLLKNLDDREKKIIILSYFHGLTDGEIAKMSSLSRRQIIKIRHNALRKLKDVITK